MAIVHIPAPSPVLRDAASIAFTPTRRNLLHWTSWLITLSALLAMTFVVRDGSVFGWEQDVERWVQRQDYPEWLFAVTSNRVTGTWEGAFIVLVVGLVLLILRQRLDAALVLFTFPLHVVANFPKALVDRERPSDMFEGIFGVGGDKSFASGHAELAFTFYGFLAYLALTRVRALPARAAIVLSWLVFAAPVGFDRIATGRHWPLDVVTGYIVGIGLLSGLIWLHRSLDAAGRRTRARTAPAEEALHAQQRLGPQPDAALKAVCFRSRQAIAALPEPVPIRSEASDRRARNAAARQPHRYLDH